MIGVLLKFAVRMVVAAIAEQWAKSNTTANLTVPRFAVWGTGPAPMSEQAAQWAKRYETFPIDEKGIHIG